VQPDTGLEPRSLLIEVQLEPPVMNDFAWHKVTLARAEKAETEFCEIRTGF
jgi:hypothetical protein